MVVTSEVDAGPTAGEAVVSTILRLHDPDAIDRLELALFSLCGQRHERLEPIVVLQRFPAEAAAEVERRARRLPWGPGVVGPRVLNPEDLGPGDQRTALLNRGIAAATGDFVGFLDYDDVLYPNAYETLLRRFADPEIAAAMGGVEILRLERDRHGGYLDAVERFRHNREKFYFFRESSYPIHSFLIRREALAGVSLPEDITIMEDYLLLLHVLAERDWSVEDIETAICGYAYWNDGSNTVEIGTTSPEKAQAWEAARAEIETFRKTHHARVRISELGRLAARAAASAQDQSITAVHALRHWLYLAALLRRRDAVLKIDAGESAGSVSLALRVAGLRRAPALLAVFASRRRALVPSLRLIWGGAPDLEEDGQDLALSVTLRAAQLNKVRASDRLLCMVIDSTGRPHRLTHPAVTVGELFAAMAQGGSGGG